MSIELSIDGENLRLRLGGIERLLALKRHLEVPAHLVTGVAALDRTAIPPGKGTWLRAPGTYIPGLIRHGSYGVPPHREFWAVFRQRRVLVVNVRDWDYARLVLGIPEPDVHASTIAAAVS